MVTSRDHNRHPRSFAFMVQAAAVFSAALIARNILRRLWPAEHPTPVVLGSGRPMTVPEDALLKNLADLEARMRTVSQESNQFSNRFLFGGIVAVVALLNTDLLLEKQIIRIPRGLPALWLVGAFTLIVVLLSCAYFWIVAQRIARFESAYRRTKHKYEVILYGLLLGSTPGGLVAELEAPLPVSGHPSSTLRHSSDFHDVAAYLHTHHANALVAIKPARENVAMAMLIVVIALAIKALIYVVTFKPA